MTDSFWGALAEAEGKEPTAKNILALGKKRGQAEAGWAFLQWELREAAKAKFSRAREMIFTREGLEMASHEHLSQLHRDLLGPGDWIDATTGIGSDAMAFGGPGVAFDLNEAHIACARHNLSLVTDSVVVTQGDCLAQDWRGKRVMVDPARRKGGRRIANPEDFEPNLTGVVEKASEAETCLIKLSPLLPDPLLETIGDRLIFAGQGWACSEALVLIGQEGQKGAMLAPTGEFLAEAPLRQEAAEPLAFVAEAHPAAIRAHALGSLGWAALGESNGYLTCPEPRLSPWLRVYPTLWHGAFRPAEIQKALSGLGCDSPIVKTRNVQQDPVKVQKSLRPGGKMPCFLMLYPQGPKVRAVLVGEKIFGNS